MLATILTERVEELRRDRRHGASWMARRAVETLADVADEPFPSSDELLARLVEAGRELAWSRPGVGAVAGAVGRLLAAAHARAALGVEDIRRLVHEEADALMSARTRAGRSIAIQLRDRLVDATVLTHSASATVRETLLHARPEQVICTVSRPLEEGRAFADELTAAGLRVELVEDEDAPDALGEASLFLVGADTVFRCGTLCNKVGTRRLSAAAAEEMVPTIVACEVIKLAPIEAGDAPALEGVAGTLFDLTPPELVDAVVTEEGSFTGEEIAALVDRTPFLRQGYALLQPASSTFGTT